MINCPLIRGAALDSCGILFRTSTKKTFLRFCSSVRIAAAAMKLDLMLVLEKINLGLTDKEVAKLFDSSEKAIAEIRATGTERGLVKRKQSNDGPRMDGEARANRRREIAKAIDAGESVEEVAKRFEVSIATVGNSVRLYGTKRQEHKPLTRAESYRVVAMLIDGQRDVDIAAATGISREMVRLMRIDADEAGIFKSLRENIKAALDAASKLG